MQVNTSGWSCVAAGAGSPRSPSLRDTTRGFSCDVEKDRTDEELREVLGEQAARILLPPLPMACAVLASAREEPLAQGESARQVQAQETCQAGGMWQLTPQGMQVGSRPKWGRRAADTRQRA